MRKLLGIKNAAAAGEKTKKATRANLGDESSFYYDEKLKAWVDKKGGSDAQASGPDDGGLPPPPTGPPMGAPPTAPVPIASARAGACAGDADAPSGPYVRPSWAAAAADAPQSASQSRRAVTSAGGAGKRTVGPIAGVVGWSETKSVIAAVSSRGSASARGHSSARCARCRICA